MLEPTITFGGAVVKPTRHDSVMRTTRYNLVDATAAKRRRKPAKGVAQVERNMCPSLLRHKVHCIIGRIDLWSSVQRWPLESV